MRGVILAGGFGTRLRPLTYVTNKHLLPVYNKPMIYYPINTLVQAGIKDILVIVSGPHSGNFLPILKNGKEFGINHLEFAYQEEGDKGIADALSLAKDFANNDNITVILGDNTMDADYSLTQCIHNFKSGSHIFLKKVKNPEDFGTAVVENNKIKCIVEKPKTFISDLAVIGMYLFDNKVFEYIDNISPSERNQLEIVDVINQYRLANTLNYSTIDFFWQDAGTFDALYLANKYWYEKELC